MTVGGSATHAGPKVGVDFSPQRFSPSATAKGEVGVCRLWDFVAASADTTIRRRHGARGT